MLNELNIKNLALIEHIELQFNAGFTTLTGETGAGKSILLDALGLALGNRADSTLVRHDTPKADVTALFNVASHQAAKAWLLEQELDSEDECYLRRTVTAEGRSKAYINGQPVPAGQLKTIGALLIDIHGQHEHQNLLSASKQVELLDAYANHPDLLNQTQQHYKTWQSIKRQLQQLETDQADYQSKFELLSFQQNEFEELDLQEGEYSELVKEQQQLSHANEIKQACEHAYASIESERGASDLVNQALQSLESIIEFSPAIAPVMEQLNSALIELQEAANDIHHHSDNIELDPQRLDLVEQRLSSLFGLAKKYTIDPEALLDKQKQINANLTQLQASDASLESLKSDLISAEKQYSVSAKKLTTSRTKSAHKLAKTVTEAMQGLGMPNGQFIIDIEESDTPTKNGVDKTTFKVTANKGQPPQALSKVASGGELSRISLAIQVATSEVTSLPTLIFDEVDVGIGGGTAEVVGEKMQTLGSHKQILSITHLPQVASHGHQHLQIQKQTQKGSTTTQVVYLDKVQRTTELARMLGGKDLTEQTLRHAEEMLQTAQEK